MLVRICRVLSRTKSGLWLGGSKAGSGANPLHKLRITSARSVPQTHRAESGQHFRSKVQRTCKLAMRTASVRANTVWSGTLRRGKKQFANFNSGHTLLPYILNLLGKRFIVTQGPGVEGEAWSRSTLLFCTECYVSWLGTCDVSISVRLISCSEHSLVSAVQLTFISIFLYALGTPRSMLATHFSSEGAEPICDISAYRSSSMPQEQASAVNMNIVKGDMHRAGGKAGEPGFSDKIHDQVQRNNSHQHEQTLAHIYDHIKAQCIWRTLLPLCRSGPRLS